MLSCRCCETAYATANSAAVIAPTIDNAALAGAASAGGFGTILRPQGWRFVLCSNDGSRHWSSVGRAAPLEVANPVWPSPSAA